MFRQAFFRHSALYPCLLGLLAFVAVAALAALPSRAAVPSAAQASPGALPYALVTPVRVCLPLAIKPACVEITYLPPYGSFADLEGRVTCPSIAPDAHRVAAYIRVSGGWWTKPTFASPLTTIRNDGTWTVDITTGGIDHLATDIAVFVVPATYSPPAMSGGATLPQELYTTAVTYLVVQRPLPPPPDNDAFRNSALLSIPAAIGGTTAGATLEGGEPQPCCQIGATVWYHVTAQDCGTLLVETAGSALDTVLAVYSGETLDHLTLLAYNDDATGRTSRVTPAVNAGQTYHIQLGGYHSAMGDFTLAVRYEGTATPCATATPTLTAAPSVTPTRTPSATSTAMSTPTVTPSRTPTNTATLTPTPSPTATCTPTATTCSPATIAFDYVPPYGSFEYLRGHVGCVMPSDFKVAVYIYVAGWWTKPTFAWPLTIIENDYTWMTEITTGGTDQYATEVAAFLIPNGYTPPAMSGGATLPAELYANSVAHVSQTRRETRSLAFAGHTWDVKFTPIVAGPGPNLFSDDPADVWVDGSGYLHLRIANRGGTWYCTEVICTDILEYGAYTVTLGSRVDLLDKNVVLGFFSWDDLAPQYHYREIDVEFSRFGDAAAQNAQYVIQPWDAAGNRHRFALGLTGTDSVHRFDWRADRVQFTSWNGSGDLLHTWTYTEPTGIPPAGAGNLRINLWLMDGNPPSDGHDVEVIVKALQYVPASPM